MENKVLFKSVVADIARLLRIRRIWPGEFNNELAVYNGVSQMEVNQARQALAQFDSVTPRMQGVQYNSFDVSLKYHVNGKVGEGESSDAAFFEAIGSFTFDQKTYIIAVSFVDVSFTNLETQATAMIVVYPAE